MGSVKDLTVVKEPTPTQMGVGRFDFSDRYSVFDWGEMPDHVPQKGASLAMMSAYFFEQLQKRGVLTHYKGMEANGTTHTPRWSGVYSEPPLSEGEPKTYTTDELSGPSTSMHVDLVRVIKPVPVVINGKVQGYDYSAFQEPLLANVLVPLEVIYRNTLPRGSSVFRRLRERALTLQEMGLSEQPQEGAVLPQPFFDVSTKLERFDRYPGWEEAQEISGLANAQVASMKVMVAEGNSIITEGVARARLRNDDGKFEFGLTPQRKLMFADAMGTLDECRFTYSLDGQWTEVSKEIPRQWYRAKQPEWVDEIDAAKKSGAEDWKSQVTIQPKPLPPQLVEMLGFVYCAAANAVLQRFIFPGTPQLGEVVKEYQRFKELEMAR